MVTDDELATIRAILDKGRIAIVTTRSMSNRLHSRPLALLGDGADFDGTLEFFTADPSSKTQDVSFDPEVNVSVADGHGYLSLSGLATVAHDHDRIAELWTAGSAAWFDGPDDPTIALLRVNVTTVEYWDMSKSLPARVIEFARGVLTSHTPDMGENRGVQLS